MARWIVIRCPKATPTSERRINHLLKLALFLPFSCNEKRQTAASMYKAKGMEPFGRTDETGIYGGSANASKRLQNERPKVRDQAVSFT
jgi:hypothetical protein